MSNSKMLVTSPSYTRNAVLIGLGKAHNRGGTSTVYCLELGKVHVQGRPFRLERLVDINRNRGMYIWDNDFIRDQDIQEGSILSFQGSCFVGNTGETMEVREVLRNLRFGDENFGLAFSGIKEAFPDAEISVPPGQGISQNYRPQFPYALIGITAAMTVDDRLWVQTRSGEVLNLSNRSRGKWQQSQIQQVHLPVQKPCSENHVSDVILCAFGEKMTEYKKYEAVCELILLSADYNENLLPEPHTLFCYPMTSQPRGICLIVNNLEFKNEKTPDRYGAERDEAALHQLFEDELGFKVHVRNDLRNFEMQQVAEEFAAKDHSEYCVFVCFLMSHGGDYGTLEGVRGRAIRIEDITTEFTSSRCPSLANKPKLFIIQACRGKSEDPNLLSANHFAADSAMGGLVNDSTLSRSDTPSESDFLYAHSTVPGYVSRRIPTSGSPFIQTLVDVIREFRGKEHFSDMLRIVNSRLSDDLIQVAALSTTLRRKLYL